MALSIRPNLRASRSDRLARRTAAVVAALFAIGSVISMARPGRARLGQRDLQLGVREGPHRADQPQPRRGRPQGAQGRQHADVGRPLAQQGHDRARLLQPRHPGLWLGLQEARRRRATATSSPARTSAGTPTPTTSPRRPSTRCSWTRPATGRTSWARPGTSSASVPTRAPTARRCGRSSSPTSAVAPPRRPSRPRSRRRSRPPSPSPPPRRPRDRPRSRPPSRRRNRPRSRRPSRHRCPRPAPSRPRLRSSMSGQNRTTVAGQRQWQGSRAGRPGQGRRRGWRERQRRQLGERHAARAGGRGDRPADRRLVGPGGPVRDDRWRSGRDLLRRLTRARYSPARDHRPTDPPVAHGYGHPTGPLRTEAHMTAQLDATRADPRRPRPRHRRRDRQPPDAAPGAAPNAAPTAAPRSSKPAT